jgi:hypothetical protein
MALSKARELKNTGISPAYWRVSHVSLDRYANGTEMIQIHVEGWINEAARTDGKLPAIAEAFRVDVLATGADLTEQAYESLKLLPEWDGATDV